MHLGKSESYAAKRSKRESRVLNRAIYGFAQLIYNAMMLGTLDPITQKTFLINSRKSKVECGIKNYGHPKQDDGMNTEFIHTESDNSEEIRQNIERERRYRKGRIRTVKGRVEKVISLPRSEWYQFVGGEWLARLELIKPTSGFNQ